MSTINHHHNPYHQDTTDNDHLDLELDPYSPGYHSNSANLQQHQQQHQLIQQQSSSQILPSRQNGLNQHQQSIEEMFDKIDLFGDNLIAPPPAAGTSASRPPQQQQQQPQQQKQSQTSNSLIDLSEFEQLLSINNNINNNNQQQPQTIDTMFQEPIFNSKKLDTLIEQLKETTLIHGEIQSEKAINENNIRSLYRQLWIVADDIQTVSEMCPCGSTVNNVFKSQISRLNIDIAKQLETLLTQNHHYNTSQFVGSLFSQSVNELRVLIYLYNFLREDGNHGEHAPNPTMDAKEAAKLNTETVILEKLVNAYSSSDSGTTVPSPPILSLLCQLSLKLKTQFENTHNNSSQQQSSKKSLIDAIDFEDELTMVQIDSGHDSSSAPSLYQQSLKRYNKILSDVTFNFKQEFISWGYTLIQPTIEDVFQRDWLLRLFHIPDVLASNQAGTTPNIKYLPEQSYINLLSQLDFKNRFSRLISYSNLNIHDKILFPLQKALELSISLKMMRLSQIICKILTLISFYFPEESEKCLGILFKSIWPSQLLSCTIMPMFNWNSISLESLPLIFMDVYQITLPPIEYLRLSDSAKQPIRYQFFHTLISYQYIINEIYSQDSVIQNYNSNSRFPQLQLLRRLAQKSLGDNDNTSFELLNDGGTNYHLSRVIFDELFYLAFIFKMSPMMYNQPGFQINLVQSLRSEIFSQLHVLLQTRPYLVNRFMYNIAQSMISIDVESLTVFLDPQGSKSPLYFWDLTGDGINWLIFIVSQRLLPTNIPDYQILDQQSRIYIQQFVIDPPPYEITVQHANIASAIASRVLMAINWTKATPVGRYKTMLMLLGGRKVLGKWIPTFVNSSRLFTNIDAGSILRPQLYEIQGINPRAPMYYSQDGGLLLYIQLLCHMNMVVVDVNEMSGPDLQQHLMNRVNQFVQTLHPLMGVNSGNIVLTNNNTLQFELLASILCMLMYLVRDRLSPNLLNDIGNLYRQITQRKQQFTPNLNILLLFIKPWFVNTIDCYSSLLVGWIRLLKINIYDEENLTILNYLANGSYLKNYGTDMIRELEALTVANSDIKTVTKSLERRPWICYMMVVAYINSQKKSNSHSKLKECLSLIKDLAVDLKSNIMSLIFWEQFWILYFELLMTTQSDPMSQDSKNHLLTNITLYMNKYPMTPPIKKIFETFTTWNKLTILSYNGEKFVTPSNDELYKLFITNALWVFAKNEDKLIQERNQKQWLEGFSKIINPKMLSDQIPMIQPTNSSDFKLEIKKYKNFEEILMTTAKNLSNYRNSNTSEFEAIRLFNDLKLYIGHSKRLSQDILNDDKVFLDLSQNLHMTTSTKQNVLIRCTNACIGVAAQYDLKTSKPNDAVQRKIQENRKQFNQNFYSLFERIYQLSLLACVVEDERLLLLFKGREVDLFKHLVDLVQDNHTDSIVSKLISTIREIAIEIGREILSKDPSNQQFLIDYFFQGNKEREQDFSIFISLFSPQHIANINKYLDTLEHCVRYNAISVKEKREIIELFKLETRIQQLFTCPSGKDRLVSLLPYFIQLPIMDSTIVLINSLLFIDSSHLINITITLVKYKVSLELIDKIFGKGKPFYEFLKSLGQSDQQNLIIQTIIELMTDTKSISALFLLNNIIFYEFLNQQFLQSLLTKIRLIYIQAIRPIDNVASPTNNPNQQNQPYLLTNSEFKLSLDFFVNLTLLIPRAVNMVWEVFYYGYMPLLDQMETQGISGVADRHTQELVELIGNLAIGGYMNVATFHIQSTDILEQMCHVICQTIYSDVVIAIFSIVDWNLLFSMEKIPDVVALHYLKLSIYMSIMNGRSVCAPETGLALASEGVSLDWYKCGDLSEASVVFDGSTFTSIIASPTLKLNPSQSIVEALTLFKDITLYLDNYSLAIALALEIRSLLYFIAQSLDKHQYWYLPFSDQLNLVQNLLLPLIRSLAENKAAKDQEQSGIQQRMKSILKITMSCLEYPHVSMYSKSECPLFFGSISTVDEQGHQDLYSKIQRIMITFCSSLSMNLCLQIMPIAHIVLQGSNYCQVMESVLHSFFTDDTVQVSPLINKYLVFTDPQLVIEKSIQNGCPLLLYIVILQQVKTNTLDVNHFLDTICSIPYSNNREYELWITWILIIKLIRTNAINLKNNKHIVQKISTIKSWIQSYFGNNNPLTSLFSKNKAILPQTHLASRACCVFLQRSILQQLGKSKDDESLLNSTSDSLMDLKRKTISGSSITGNGGSTHSQYSSFNQFFEQAENFLSPIVEIDDFSQILIQTLVPFASYLLNLLKYE